MARKPMRDSFSGREKFDEYVVNSILQCIDHQAFDANWLWFANPPVHYAQNSIA
jgi:hypothetical protein